MAAPTARLGLAAAELADQLTAVGVSTTPRAEKLALPGGWLTVETVAADRFDGDTWSVRWALYLIAGDYDTLTALDVLGGMYEHVAHMAAGEARALTVSLPNYSAQPLPALLVNIDTELTP